MSRYRNNPQAIQALVRPEEVHRDLYVDRELFDLEMERLWRRTWIYVGHESQIPNPGDFYTTQLAREPVIMVRGSDALVRVLPNRCAHKGSRLVTAVQGKCPGGALRCPYHGWTYRLDGKIRTIPLKSGYEGTGFESSDSAKGLREICSVNYRGFVFARLGDGPGFQEYFGDSLSSIDNMVERSPQGRLEVAGGVLRYMHDCNWKLFVENLNDAMHPMVAHESSAGTAKRTWASAVTPGGPVPMVIEQFVPFVNGYDFFDKMGVKVYPNGHSYTGVSFSIHSKYSQVEEYERLMEQSYGTERAQRILGEVRHNTVYYPSLTIKGAIQAIRVVRPLAVDKTLIESWTFRLVGAPEELLARTTTYSRLINAPTSVVGHDDLHCYRSIQEGLAGGGSDWVSLHRNYSPAEAHDFGGTYGATNEVPMRGQFHAWARFMTAGMGQGEA